MGCNGVYYFMNAQVLLHETADNFPLFFLGFLKAIVTNSCGSQLNRLLAVREVLLDPTRYFLFGYFHPAVLTAFDMYSVMNLLALQYAVLFLFSYFFYSLDGRKRFLMYSKF